MIIRFVANDWLWYNVFVGVTIGVALIITTIYFLTYGIGEKTKAKNDKQKNDFR
jgi:hypothetical protein